MTTPGEGFTDKQGLNGQDPTGNRSDGNSESAKQSDRDSLDPMENILKGDHARGVDKGIGIGLAALLLVAGTSYGAYHFWPRHHTAKKPLAENPEQPYPNTRFMTNLDESILHGLIRVTETYGSSVSGGDFDYLDLRADQLDAKAACQTPEKDIQTPVKTIVIYEANHPKEAFREIRPTVGEQTALARFSSYSNLFPAKFATGSTTNGETTTGRIGTPRAIEAAAEIKEDPCVDKGIFLGYRNQKLERVVPYATSEDSTGSTGEVAGLIILCVAGLAILKYYESTDHEEKSSTHIVINNVPTDESNPHKSKSLFSSPFTRLKDHQTQKAQAKPGHPLAEEIGIANSEDFSDSTPQKPNTDN